MKEIDKYKARFMACWMVASIQAISAWIMFNRAQAVHSETGSWMSSALIIAINLLIVALLFAFLGLRTYRRLKAMMPKDEENQTKDNKKAGG